MNEIGEKSFENERDMLDVYFVFPIPLAREINSLAKKHRVSITKALGEFITVSSMTIWALKDDDSEMVLCWKDGYEEPFVFTTVLLQKKYQNVKNSHLSDIYMWLKMPKETVLELDYLAEENNITTNQVLHSFIEFGLTVDKIDQFWECDLFLREKGQEDTKITLFEYGDCY